MRKLIASILMITVLFCNIVFTTVDTQIEMDLKNVSVTGTSTYAEEPVSIQVYDANRKYYIGQDMTDAEGKFEFSFQLEEGLVYEGKIKVNDVVEIIAIDLTDSSDDSTDGSNDNTDNSDNDDDDDVVIDVDVTDLPSSGLDGSLQSQKAQLEESDFESGFAKAHEDENTNKKTATFKIDIEEGVEQVSVVFSSEMIGKARDNNIDRIVIDTGLARVSFSPETILEDELTGDIELVVTQVDVSGLTLSDDERTMLEGKTVYNFDLYYNGVKKSNFNTDEPMEITIPYELDEDENPECVVVYYINDQGELEVVRNGKYDPETKTVTFTTDHFSKYSAAHVNVDLLDLDEVQWAKSYVEYLAAREIVLGEGNGKFNPNGTLTREAYIKMLVEAFDFVDEEATTTLSDVDKDAWYYTYIASAQSLGITNGVGDNMFGVGQEISREEMATMAYRTLSIMNINLDETGEMTLFDDDDQISDYAKASVYAMQRASIIQGDGTGVFNPQDNASRAEAAKIIYMLMQ